MRIIHGSGYSDEDKRGFIKLVYQVSTDSERLVQGISGQITPKSASFLVLIDCLLDSEYFYGHAEHD